MQINVSNFYLSSGKKLFTSPLRKLNVLNKMKKETFWIDCVFLSPNEFLENGTLQKKENILFSSLIWINFPR